MNADQRGWDDEVETLGGLAADAELAERALAECRDMGTVAIDIDADALLLLIACAQTVARDMEFPAGHRMVIRHAACQARDLFRASDRFAAAAVIHAGFREPS